MTQSKAASVALLVLLGTTFLSVFPGLYGSFIFDDFHNLDSLGFYGGAASWEGAKAFVFSGQAGPMGRPLALATFLLNDQYWPSQPWSFKYTNLLIHLLVGLAVCWATLNLLRVLGRSEQEATWIAVLSAGIWLLHPYFVSTTLYVIQRMTQLAALFSLFGIAAYLHGRQVLVARGGFAGYVWMTCGLVLGGVLATLSKENGVLLPVLILAIEACLPSLRGDKTFRLWRVVFLWLPTIIIFGYLAKHVNFAADIWPNRPFNQVERLNTEAIIVVEYLWDLVVPKFEGRGLYQDGFAISQDPLHPPVTLVSMAILASLFLFALAWRRRYPILALPILFFFAGHLLESTVIGLELYFEHRNYLPAAFLFLPIATGIVELQKRFSSSLAVTIAIILFSMLGFMTWQRATLWSSGYKLLSYWALKSPESPRAQNSLAHILIDRGRPDDARKVLDDAVQRLPDSAHLTMALLMLKVADGSAEEKDFAWAGARLATQPFDAQAIKGVYNLVDFVTYKDARVEYANYSLQLLASMAQNPRYMKFPLFERFLPFQEGRIYLYQNQPDKAFERFRVAMPLYGNVDSSMEMVVLMAGHGEFEHALTLLDDAEAILMKQSDKDLARGRATYDLEIQRIRQNLRDDLAKGKGK